MLSTFQHPNELACQRLLGGHTARGRLVRHTSSSFASVCYAPMQLSTSTASTDTSDRVPRAPADVRCGVSHTLTAAVVLSGECNASLWQRVENSKSSTIINPEIQNEAGHERQRQGDGAYARADEAGDDMPAVCVKVVAIGAVSKSLIVGDYVKAFRW